MIDRDILIEDLEAESFGRFCQLIARRPREQWRWILKSGGVEVNAVGEGERTVEIDLDLIAPLVEAMATAADPALSYQEWTWRCHEIFWSSPAISSNLPPPANPWPEAVRRLAEVGEVGTLVIGDLRMTAHLDGGRIVLISGSESIAGPEIRLTWEEFENLLAQPAPDWAGLLTNG